MDGKSSVGFFAKRCSQPSQLDMPGKRRAGRGPSPRAGRPGHSFRLGTFLGARGRAILGLAPSSLQLFLAWRHHGGITFEADGEPALLVPRNPVSRNGGLLRSVGHGARTRRLVASLRSLPTPQGEAQPTRPGQQESGRFGRRLLPVGQSLRLRWWHESLAGPRASGLLIAHSPSLLPIRVNRLSTRAASRPELAARSTLISWAWSWTC